MSVYVRRYYEVYDKGQWIPIKNNNKLLYNVDNLSNCRAELYEYSNHGLPDDVSNDIKEELKSPEYYYNHGYCTLNDLYNFLNKEEESLKKALINNTGFIDGDPHRMTNRELLISIFKHINCDIDQIYDDYSYIVYGFTFLIGEVSAVTSFDYFSPNNIRLIFAFE